MKEILRKSIFEIDFSGLKASVIFWLVATCRYQRVRYDGLVSELLPVKCTSGFDLGTCAFCYLH